MEKPGNRCLIDRIDEHPLGKLFGRLRPFIVLEDCGHGVCTIQHLAQCN
jgi:hypothetical protein